MEQLLVMNVQTGSTLTPSKNYSTHFHFVMGGGACARILECRFLVPYFPFIFLKILFVSYCNISKTAYPHRTLDACVSVGELWIHHLHVGGN